MVAGVFCDVFSMECEDTVILGWNQRGEGAGTVSGSVTGSARPCNFESAQDVDSGRAISDVVPRHPPDLSNVSDNVRGGNPRRTRQQSSLD